MAEVRSTTPRASGGIRATSIATAIAVHGLIAVGLVLGIEIPRLATAPVIHVSLVPAWRIQTKAAPHHKPPPPAPPAQVAPRAARASGAAEVPPLPIAAAPVDAETRQRLMTAPFMRRDRVRDALRTSTGCSQADWLKLSPAEREACRERTHVLGAGAPTYAVGPADAAQRAFFDKQAARNEKAERQRRAPAGAADTPFVNCIGVEDGRLGCPLPPP